MEGQLCIAEAKKDFSNSAAQHLIGTHATSTFSLGYILSLFRSCSTRSQKVEIDYLLKKVFLSYTIYSVNIKGNPTPIIIVIRDEIYINLIAFGISLISISLTGSPTGNFSIFFPK